MSPDRMDITDEKAHNQKDDPSEKRVVLQSAPHFTKRPASSTPGKKLNLASIKSQTTIKTFNGWVSSQAEAELINNPIPCQHASCRRFFMPDHKLFSQQWQRCCFCSAEHHENWRMERQQELDSVQTDVRQAQQDLDSIQAQCAELAALADCAGGIGLPAARYVGVAPS